jgi:8-oxo-dGTP pyrophosphatase MutT (NUDIX family)
MSSQRKEVMNSPKFFEHQLTENVKLLQKVVIIRDQNGRKEALLLQRTADSASRPNCWDLPGGNSNWPKDVTVSTANLHQLDVVREVEEETTLKTDPKNFKLANLAHFSTYFEADKQILTIICGWQLDYSATDGAELKISDEHQDFAWANLLLT